MARSMPKPSESTSRRVTEVAGLLTLIALGAVRLLYEEYYRAIHTSVDQVGLSAWRMVTAPVAALVALCGAGVPALFMAVITYRMIKSKIEAVLFATLTLFLAYVAIVAILWDTFRRAWLPAGVLIGALAILTAVITPAWVQRRDQLRLLRNSFLGLVCLVLVAVWSLAWVNAPHAARSLRADGTSAGGVDVLLDIDAEPVCVISLGNFGLPPDRPLLLLGETNGAMVLRDVRGRSTIRVPSSSVVLRSPRGRLCG